MIPPEDYPWLAATSNVWVILRLSREEVDRSREGVRDVLAKHRSLLLRLAAGYGIAVPAGRIVEEIESGDTIAGRPRFLATLKEWERLPFGAGFVVLSTEVARLTRGLQSDQGRVQDAFVRGRGLHITPARWYDLRIPDHSTAWELEGFAARLELRAFKWRMQLGMDELLARGRSRNGRPPFGWVWDKRGKEFEADPARFPLVVAWCRDIFTLSTYKIAARDGVSDDVVLKTLQNPTICGCPARRWGPHHGQKPWKTPDVLLPRAEWQWPDQAGKYPPACTRGEWEAIQEALSQRRAARAKTGTSENGWCRDVVRFVDGSGRVKLASAYGPRVGGTYLTYDDRPAGKPKLCVARAAVHAVAEAALARACRDPGALLAGLAASREQEEERWSVQRAAGRGRQAELAQELGRVRSALDRVTALLVDADEAEERASLGRVQAEKLALLRTLKAEMSDIQAGSPPGPGAVLAPEALEAIAGAFDAVWAETPGEARRALVNAVIEAIDVEVVRGRACCGHERRVHPARFQPWLLPFLGP